MEIIFGLSLAVALFYFGSNIARGAETLSTMTDTRLEDLEAEQLVVSAVRRAKTSSKAKKFIESGKITFSNKELKELLKGKKEDK
jgi:hypothetical protein